MQSSIEMIIPNHQPDTLVNDSRCVFYRMILPNVSHQKISPPTIHNPIKPPFSYAFPMVFPWFISPNRSPAWISMACSPPSDPTSPTSDDAGGRVKSKRSRRAKRRCRSTCLGRATAVENHGKTIGNHGKTMETMENHGNHGKPWKPWKTMGKP